MGCGSSKSVDVVNITVTSSSPLPVSQAGCQGPSRQNGDGVGACDGIGAAKGQSGDHSDGGRKNISEQREKIATRTASIPSLYRRGSLVGHSPSSFLPDGFMERVSAQLESALHDSQFDVKLGDSNNLLNVEEVDEQEMSVSLPHSDTTTDQPAMNLGSTLVDKKCGLLRVQGPCVDQVRVSSLVICLARATSLSTAQFTVERCKEHFDQYLLHISGNDILEDNYVVWKNIGQLAKEKKLRLPNQTSIVEVALPGRLLSDNSRDEFLRRLNRNVTKVWSSVDKDSNGILDKDEFLLMMTHKCWDDLRLSDEDKEDLWNRIDSNGDGSIEFKEFVPFITELLQTKVVDVETNSFSEEPDRSPTSDIHSNLMSVSLTVDPLDDSGVAVLHHQFNFLPSAKAEPLRAKRQGRKSVTARSVNFAMVKEANEDEEEA